MLEKYFSEGFTILEYNDNNLVKLPNDVKQRPHAEETDNSDKAVTCINTITSTSNTLKNLVWNKSLHSSCIQTWFNDKNKIIINIFSAYVEPLLKISTILNCFKNENLILMLKRMKYIYIDASMSKPSDKKSKCIIMIATCTVQPQ